jgi:hypothetical protein
VVGLEIKTEKTVCPDVSSKECRTTHNTKIANESFENLVEFKYFRTALTNQNYMHEEVKSK